ncbi:hypothetical protein [[Mycoplasma] testudinis]|uniref:hypothetical protein n=1 Tax=[Mycoplasma] testudinis TaxID=33924 RepID=UPI000ABE3CD4|nr:hypothetical protein [[Mycoplasma] testudinis]
MGNSLTEKKVISAWGELTRVQRLIITIGTLVGTIIAVIGVVLASLRFLDAGLPLAVIGAAVLLLVTFFWLICPSINKRRK